MAPITLRVAHWAERHSAAARGSEAVTCERTAQSAPVPRTIRASIAGRKVPPSLTV